MDAYPDLLPAVRQRLQDSGRPWILENVPGAPMPGAIQLCGSLFGLQVWRHRLFESKYLMLAPGFCSHTFQPVTVAGHLSSRRQKARAMGIDWMSSDELNESVPPAYSEYLGKQLMWWIGASDG